jgi:competence protein ComEA
MIRVLFGSFIACFVLAGAAALSAQGQAPSPPKAAGATQIVNLNTATATQIARLPGIGEKAAQRIIEYREKNGGFKKIEELMNVKGIGEKSFLKLKPLITVGDKPARQQQ